jgi:hypothetical protein
LGCDRLSLTFRETVSAVGVAGTESAVCAVGAATAVGDVAAAVFFATAGLALFFEEVFTGSSAEVGCSA